MDITVSRTGDTSGTASVGFATSDSASSQPCNVVNGIASSRCDYINTAVRLTFAAGETSKTVSVLIVDDLYLEGNETFSVNLLDPAGAALGAQSTATVTITDNDTVAAGSNTAVAQLDRAQETSANLIGEAVQPLAGATGAGSVTLINNQTQGSVNLNFSGLSSAQTGAHIHGPAHVGKSASIIFPLPSGSFTNFIINLTPTQMQQLRAGLFYMNVHSMNFPNGEIRGQLLINPLESARFFVQEHYYDFLNRYPDQGGWDFWTNEITSCGADLACVDVKHINVSAAYFLSIEFQQTGYLVERMYKSAYGSFNGTSTFGGTHTLQVPIVRFNEFVPDTQRIGQGVVVGQTGWEAVLENNKQAFASEFVQRSRFTSVFATTLTPAQFVDALFANAGVTPSSTDRNAAIADFGTATNTIDVAARGRALRKVAENSTLVTSEFNRAFVLMQFFGYLRRNPNDPQDIDYTGYDFWLAKLNQFNGNFVSAEMVKAFITSTEYRQRFGP